MSLLCLDDWQAKQLLSCHMVVSNGQIREIDISGPARALRFLRMTDYLLVILCGSWLLNLLALPFVEPEMRWGGELLFNVAAIIVLVFSVYAGWRHVGVIDARVWRVHMIAFPLLAFFCVLVLASTLFTGFNSNDGIKLENFQEFNSIFTMLWLSGGAIAGFVSVLLLRKMRIAAFGVPLVELLRDLKSYEGKRDPEAKTIKKVDAPRGTVFGVLGGLILLVVVFAPLPNNSRMASNYARISQQISLLGYFMLIRARRYFQISAASLLSVDKRKPILFLRSFEDDERVKFGGSEKAFLDFSLETRLLNHFAGFGPFIAIGSPKDPIPQIGAARAVLSDSEWQPRVMAWMSEASVIVMYSGKSQWVTWELAKLVNTERVAKLILMIPEVKGWRSAIRSKDIAARMEHVRDAFGNTKWRGALAALQNSQDVRAMLFRSDGSLVVIKSRPRNRDSYHLAALIAHYILLKETSAILVGINEAVQDRQFPVDTEIFYIGAAEDNNLSIKDDDYISGHHALLRYERGKLSIADQHSKNGTFVNGNRLGDAPVTVNLGDQIRMGHSTFEVAHAENKNRARAA
jgi:FHA domain